MKKLIMFIVLVAVAGYVYSTYGQPLLTTITAYEAQPSTEEADNTIPEAPVNPAVWTLQDQPEKEGIPQTAVMLSYNGVSHLLGTHAGSCFLIEESGWELLSEEETGVICYFAGGGVELGVFNRNNVLTVEQGVVDEGSAEVSGFRGDFVIIKAL